MSKENKKIFAVIQMAIGIIIELYGLKNIFEGTRYHHMDETTLVTIVVAGAAFLLIGYINFIESDKKD